MSLKVQSFKQTHQTLSLFEDEGVILLNTIYSALYIYYLYYEVLSHILSYFGYPKLPKASYLLPSNGRRSDLSLSVTIIIKATLLMSGPIGLLGAASWKLRYTMLSVSINAIFVLHDIYLLLLNRFHWINPDDFLLFQSLYTTTLRMIRVFTTIANLIHLWHFLFNLPQDFTFMDFF